MPPVLSGFIAGGADKLQSQQAHLRGKFMDDIDINAVGNARVDGRCNLIQIAADTGQFGLLAAADFRWRLLDLFCECDAPQESGHRQTRRARLDL